MIIFQGQEYEREPQETVLDCLLRHGVDAPHSCRSGVCQTCLMQAVKGDPGENAQKGLKPSLVSQNYFLSCSCHSEQDLEIMLPNTQSFQFPSRVVSKDPLTNEITRIRLEKPSSFAYRPGQYLSLYNPDGVARSYSLASVPVLEPFLELHIRHVKKGLISEWVRQDLRSGDEVIIGQAIGNCFYVNDQNGQTLLLIGTGSGLAPLYGIVRDALHQGHTGKIKLYHGSGSVAGLYLMEELRVLARRHANFEYFPCVSQEAPQDGMLSGRATDRALSDNPKMSGWRAYICGNPEMVNATGRAVFLAGISLQEVYTDSFLPSKP